MRVLHVIGRYWPARGGAEAYLHEISRRLVRDGHEVTILTTDALDVEVFWNPRRQRIPEREAEQDGVRIRRFPVRHLPFSPRSYAAWRYLGLIGLAHLPLPAGLLTRLARYTPWTPGLWQWLAGNRERYDVVGGAMILYEPLVAAAQQFARRRGAPFVVYPFTHLGAGAQPGRDAVSRYYTMRHQVDLVVQSQALVSMTPTERDFYVARGFRAEAACVAGAGVTPSEVLGGDGQRFRARHGITGGLVAFVSALTYDKGAEHLVEAVRRLWQAGRPVELALAGAVLLPFQRFLERLPGEVRQRLRVLGPISEADKRDLLAAADVVAMPSRTDSFGIVYLEAWLYRKPVIGARAWGMSDVIAHDVDGLLVPFGDVGALAEALAGLLDNPARCAALGQAGEKKVYQQYTWEHVYGRVSEVYRRQAAARASIPPT
jgi:glycogen(starch) synthase